MTFKGVDLIFNRAPNQLSDNKMQTITLLYSKLPKLS